jgi:hypothetical protein
MRALFSGLVAAAILATGVSWAVPALCCPAAAEPPVPPVEALIHTYGPFALKPGLLQQMPPAMQVVFPEELWLVGYRTEILDKAGSPLPRELQCHTYIGTSMPAHHSHDTVDGLFSDGYTPGLDLPQGFGIHVKSGEKLLWTPMFNNRSDETAWAAMRLELKVTRSRELSRTLKPLETTFRSVHEPDLYMAPPGRSTESSDFTLPVGHTIHVIGTHIHPYGTSIELVNTRRKQTVWKATGTHGADGKLVSMPVYSDVNGYEVRSGDAFRLIAIYDNPTRHPVDAMAGVFILYSEGANLSKAGN